MKRWFPDAEVVVFGHSHEPVDGYRTAVPVQPRLCGATPATARRTVGVLELAAGVVVGHRIVPVT